MSIHNFSVVGYQRHNAARLNHLASLGLNLRGRLVLEVGSGPGDHTTFYLQRRCKVVATDARPECVHEVLRKHAGKNVEARVVNMNEPNFSDEDKFEVVHCYGLLYHLKQPDVALAALGKVCSDLLVLETVVSHAAEGIEFVPESVNAKAPDLTQSTDGHGCRPSRKWVMDELRKHFPHVYMTRTQPAHPEFPTDWTQRPKSPLSRAVFVASRKPLDELFFSTEVLDGQSSG